MVGQLTHVAVLPFADIVLLTSSSATAIIFGIILSVWVLGEPFTANRDLPAVILIIIGCLMTVTFANKDQETYTLADLTNKLVTPQA